MIVTVTPTIIDGTVVRWYASEAAAVRGQEMASASRNGVIPPEPLDPGAAEIRAAADAAYEVLKRDNNADLDHLATHRRQSLFGPLVPIERSTPPC